VAKEGEYRGLLITAAPMGRKVYLEQKEETIFITPIKKNLHILTSC
jgi:hypothetical protein